MERKLEINRELAQYITGGCGVLSSIIIITLLGNLYLFGGYDVQGVVTVYLLYMHLEMYFCC